MAAISKKLSNVTNKRTDMYKQLDVIVGLNDDLLDSATKEQLKLECRRRGRKTTGNRAEMIQRLRPKMSTKKSEKLAAGDPNESNSRRRSSDKLGATNKSDARARERAERENLVLWKHPLTTLDYFSREILFSLRDYTSRIKQYGNVAIIIAIATIILVQYVIYTNELRTFGQLFWIARWIGLGVLSSVGFGTGLHTFLLYLGPHIAKVTLAAYECNALNFPEPPYPDETICPSDPDLSFPPSIWNIMSKVRLEAMLWGAGTALGELPPYFMARTARLSGYDPDDEDDLREFQEMQQRIRDHPESLSFVERLKVAVERLVERAGFIGILACASIPNPLFDLAGITCGHFLVPFWTFFGATLIGKAVIKMHLQKLFVIIAFNETLIARAVNLLSRVPMVGAKLQTPFVEYLNKQKTNLHRDPSRVGEIQASESMLARVFELLVMGMIVYFLLSIVHSLAQSYHKRVHKKSESRPAGELGGKKQVKKVK